MYAFNVSSQVSGSIDNSFDMSVGANNSIITTAINNSGKIYAAGAFTTFNSSEKNRIV